MSPPLGPIEIECDAPPYPIVKECRCLGMRDPEGVRWCRLGRSPSQPAGWWRRFHLPSWAGASPPGLPGRSGCPCGRGLPALVRHAFLLSSGREVVYRIGQCFRCRTIYWSEGD